MMDAAFLDTDGVKHLWGEIEGRLAGGGGCGPDGNPIGTIISYMGKTAPKDYLICDGTEYEIAQHSELARFFKEQFGSPNHFGGDGETTFAVPDLRNLFLRGYHGESEEQLSGEVGEKQEASRHVKVTPWIVGPGVGTLGSNISNSNDIEMSIDDLYDTVERGGGYFDVARASIVTDEERIHHYTSRPVNAAVLYCIKAVESVPAGDVYSTEETRIGTWIDGKPLYRKSFSFEFTTKNVEREWTNFDTDTTHMLVRGYGMLDFQDWRYNVPFVEYDKSSNSHIVYGIGQTKGRGIWFHSYTSGPISFIANLTIEYTKTTD